jgi:hypothetical protein
MDTAELVRHKLESLPPDAQREVLDFVEYLEAKHRVEDKQWSAFSLTSAMAGMESDEWPEYRDEDFTERWR